MTHDNLYLVRIDKVQYTAPNGRYAPPFFFEATVLLSFKGGAEQGQVIRGITGKEAPMAICSVDLREGETYLLMLSGDTMPYVVSRYSLTVGSKDEPFEGYLSQVKEAYGVR